MEFNHADGQFVTHCQLTANLLPELYCYMNTEKF